MSRVDHSELHILVVDDETESLNEIVEYLEGHDFVCHPAPDAAAALILAKKMPEIGVVVTDIRMPGQDGLAMIEDMKSEAPPEAHREFVVLTGFAGHDEHSRSMALQVFDFIEKPVDLARLSDIVWSARETALSKRFEHQHAATAEQDTHRSHDQLDAALRALHTANRTLAAHDAEILAERARFRNFLDVLRWGQRARFEALHDLLVMAGPDDMAEDFRQRLADGIDQLEQFIEAVGDPLSVGTEEIEHLPDKEFNLFRLLDRLVKRFEPMAKERGVRVRFNAHEMKENVQGRVQLLAQAIGAVLANAIDYTPRRHGVTVELEHSIDHMKIVVTDEGMGISPEAVKVALAPLQSIARPVGRSRKGLGLGLTTAVLIVGLHGGDIALKSDRGKGTTVTITLPIAKTE